jgi:hypothetical protein
MAPDALDGDRHEEVGDADWGERVECDRKEVLVRHGVLRREGDLHLRSKPLVQITKWDHLKPEAPSGVPPESSLPASRFRSACV